MTKEGDIEKKLEEITKSTNVEKEISYRTSWSPRKKASVWGTVTVLALLGVYLLTKNDEQKITGSSTVIDENPVVDNSGPPLSEGPDGPGVDLIQGMFDMGRDYLESGNTEKAIETYEMFTNLYPMSAPGWNNLGIAYKRAGRDLDAINAYEKSLEQNPNAVSVLVNTAGLYHDQKEYKKALDLVDKVLEIDPSNGEAVDHRSDLNRHIKEEEKNQAKNTNLQRQLKMVEDFNEEISEQTKLARYILVQDDKSYFSKEARSSSQSKAKKITKRLPEIKKSYNEVKKLLNFTDYNILGNSMSIKKFYSMMDTLNAVAKEYNFYNKGLEARVKEFKSVYHNRQFKKAVELSKKLEEDIINLKYLKRNKYSAEIDQLDRVQRLTKKMQKSVNGEGKYRILEFHFGNGSIILE